MDTKSSHVCAVVQTKDQILAFTDKGIETIIETQANMRLSPINAVQSNSGHVYCVSEEISSQNSNVIEISFTEEGKIKNRTVVSINTAAIVVL